MSDIFSRKQLHFFIGFLTLAFKKRLFVYLWLRSIFQFSAQSQVVWKFSSRPETALCLSCKYFFVPNELLPDCQWAQNVFCECEAVNLRRPLQMWLVLTHLHIEAYHTRQNWSKIGVLHNENLWIIDNIKKHYKIVIKVPPSSIHRTQWQWVQTCNNQQ